MIALRIVYAYESLTHMNHALTGKSLRHEQVGDYTMAKDARSTVFQAGIDEGKRLTKIRVLEHLEAKYIDDKENRPERGSPEAKMILDLARDLSKSIEEWDL